MGRGPKGPVATLAPGQAGQDPQSRRSRPPPLLCSACTGFQAAGQRPWAPCRGQSRWPEPVPASARSRPRSQFTRALAAEQAAWKRGAQRARRCHHPSPPVADARRLGPPPCPALHRLPRQQRRTLFPHQMPRTTRIGRRARLRVPWGEGKAQQGYSAPTVTERCDPHRARCAHWLAPHSKPSIIHPTPPAHLTSTSVTLPCSTRSVAVRSCGAMASSAARSSAARRRICEAAKHEARPSAACPTRLAC